ncbi:hypothetical protein AB836_00790 [Rickettsiales bacterium (ex Bugula neritina AB1)]|nr:hypothetical protein AB836_00790 [Rickettsiales bacterium (ex Bugula neritina AB1)]
MEIKKKKFIFLENIKILCLFSGLFVQVQTEATNQKVTYQQSKEMCNTNFYLYKNDEGTLFCENNNGVLKDYLKDDFEKNIQELIESSLFNELKDDKKMADFKEGYKKVFNLTIDNSLNTLKEFLKANFFNQNQEKVTLKAEIKDDDLYVTISSTCKNGEKNKEQNFSTIIIQNINSRDNFGGLFCHLVEKEESNFVEINYEKGSDDKVTSAFKVHKTIGVIDHVFSFFSSSFFYQFSANEPVTSLKQDLNDSMIFKDYFNHYLNLKGDWTLMFTFIFSVILLGGIFFGGVQISKYFDKKTKDKIIASMSEAINTDSKLNSEVMNMRNFKELVLKYFPEIFQIIEMDENGIFSVIFNMKKTLNVSSSIHSINSDIKSSMTNINSFMKIMIAQAVKEYNVLQQLFGSNKNIEKKIQEMRGVDSQSKFGIRKFVYSVNNDGSVVIKKQFTILTKIFGFLLFLAAFVGGFFAISQMPLDTIEGDEE